MFALFAYVMMIPFAATGKEPFNGTLHKVTKYSARLLKLIHIYFSALN